MNETENKSISRYHHNIDLVILSLALRICHHSYCTADSTTLYLNLMLASQLNTIIKVKNESAYIGITVEWMGKQDFMKIGRFVDWLK